jgi:hypothetical protein
VVLSFLSPRSLPAGPIDSVRLIATVPTNAPYRDKHILDLTGIQINEGAIPAAERLDAFFCTYGAERPRVGQVVTALDLADLEFRTRRRRAVPS